MEKEESLKAFLSHSSKDKYFVSKVAEFLGDTQIEYDEITFEFALNNQAVSNALRRSDIFVFFLSKNSLGSAFVREEERAAFEARARGQIRNCLVVAIDDTSYKALPEWLRSLNIVANQRSPKACARKIQALLTATQLISSDANELYLGREEDEKLLTKAIAAPASKTPIYLHAVGQPGIGRKTFLRRGLQKLFPRLFGVFVDITLQPFAGYDDLYRSLFSLNFVASLQETIEDFTNFSKQSDSEKLELVAQIIETMVEDGEFISITDEGAVYADDGDFQPLFKQLLTRLENLTRPAISLIQTRMMPLTIRQKYERSFHIHLRPLSDESVRELLSLELKERDIAFTEIDIEKICEWLDGHPYNVKFAVKYIEEYGIKSIVADPSELIEWKRQRAEDFLSRIEFSDQQADILATLSEYRYLAAEMLFELFDSGSTARDLRLLEEFCCIERRHDFFHISAPLREAVRRDSRFDRPDSWKQQIGSKICDAISQYEGEDSISVEILESGTIAAAKGSVAPSFLSQLILPSHLLRIARDFYDKRHWNTCAEFCRRAWELRTGLPRDAHVELLRLWGLSAIRMNDRGKQDFVFTELRNYYTKTARRVRHFLKGFAARLSGNMEEAEEEFLKAYEISSDNESVNREIAGLYCRQRRYVEAERHAKAAYDRYPTNPFLIDIYAEALLGKQHQGMPVDRHEIGKVLADLRRYGDAPGSSFYLIRDAQQKSRRGDIQGALRALDSAMDRTPDLLRPYFIRAEIFLSQGDVTAAQRDLVEVNRLLNQSGGSSREDEAQAQELEIKILIEKLQFDAAKDKIDHSHFLARKVTHRLLSQVARSVAFKPDAASPRLRDWARSFKPQSFVEADTKS